MRYFYLVKNFIKIEVGIGGFFRLLLSTLMPAIVAGISAVIRGLTNEKKGFDWHTFRWAFGIAIFTVVFLNLISQNNQVKRFLSPSAGRRWREGRKATTAAIIKKINLCLVNQNRSVIEVRKILSDILDVIVLHVRDHKCSLKEHKEFSNILLNDMVGNNLIVVARDRVSDTGQYPRSIPAVYSKVGMLCAEAIQFRKVMSHGNIKKRYPSGPQNKPYCSVFAIPLIGTNDQTVHGVLSIDSSQPHFFDGFSQVKAENELENSLQPYIQLIILTLESLISKDTDEILRAFR